MGCTGDQPNLLENAIPIKKQELWALSSIYSMRVHNSQQICEILTLPQGPFYNPVPADLKPMQKHRK